MTSPLLEFSAVVSTLSSPLQLPLATTGEITRVG